MHLVAQGNVVGHDDYCFGQATNESSGDVTTDVLFCYHERSDVTMTLYPIGKLYVIALEKSQHVFIILFLNIAPIKTYP